MADLVAKLKLETNNFDSKVKSAQRSLDQFGLKGTDVGNKIGNLSQILQTNISKVGAWGAALGAGAAAIKVIGDALKRNEIVMDEWGRVTESAGALYDGFLNVLNTGDIGGFLNNIDDIVNAAREAYDALDELGTFNAFNQINKGKARTKFTQAIADYRQGMATKEDAKAAGSAYKAELQTQADKEQAAYEATIKKIAASRDVDYEMLKKALSGSYGEYESLKAMMPSKEVRTSKTMADGTQWESTKIVFANEQEELGAMLRKLTDEELQNLQALGAQAENTRTEIAGIDRQMARFLGKTETPKTPTTTPQAETPDYLKNNLFSTSRFGSTPTEGGMLQQQQQMLTTMMNDLSNFDTSDAFQWAAASLEDINEQMALWKDQYAEVCKLAEDTNEVQSEGVKTSGAVTTNAQGTVDAWQNAAIALQAAASAMNAIDDPAAKVAGTLAQAVASIMLGFAQASIQGAALGPWGWIAATMSGLATAISTVATIKSVTSGFEYGGTVLPNGSPYHGDNIVARLNAGEGVLTERGVQTAEQLSGKAQISVSGGNLSTKLKGGDILIALDNTNRSRGGSRGTYAYSK